MNHKEIIHCFLSQRIKKTDRVIDMTCGNGHDTLFLANRAREVIAVDIQVQAIENTKIRCNSKSNVKYFHMNHSAIDFKETIDGAVYNLGYLPKSDQTVITKTQSTLDSLKIIIKKEPKYLSIASYPGHPGGKEEYLALRAFLDTQAIEYIEIRYSSKNSPVSFLVDFVKPSSSLILVDELRHLPRIQAWTKVQSILLGT